VLSVGVLRQRVDYIERTLLQLQESPPIQPKTFGFTAKEW